MRKAYERRPDFKAGDLIGFSDPGAIGTAINLATWGIPGWGLSHVGILAGHPDYDRLLLFESTTLAESPCVIAKLHTSGVQAHHLQPRLAGFAGRVWHYPLRGPFAPPSLGDWTQNNAKLIGYLMAHLGTAYDALGAWRTRSTPLGILERLFCGYEENLASLFCSEFVAAAWREAGIWNTGNASRWSPNSLARAAVRRGVCDRPKRIK